MSNIDNYTFHRDLHVNDDFKYNKENIKDAPPIIPRGTAITPYNWDKSDFFKPSRKNQLARIKYFNYLEKNNMAESNPNEKNNLYTCTIDGKEYDIIIADKKINVLDGSVYHSYDSEDESGGFGGGGYQPTKKYARRTIKGKSKTSKGKSKTSKGKSKTSKGKSKTSKGKSKTIKGKSKTRHLIR